MKSIEVIISSFKVLFDNIVAFFLAFLIWIFLGFFIIPIPPLLFGLYYMANKAIKGDKPSWKDVFKGFDYLVISWALVILGFIICGILIGIFLIIAYSDIGGFFIILISFLVTIIIVGIMGYVSNYAIPVIIEKNIGLFPAIKESISLFRRKFITTITVSVLIIIIQFALVMTVIGIVVAYVIPVVIPAIVFTKLAIEE